MYKAQFNLLLQTRGEWGCIYEGEDPAGTEIFSKKQLP
jgi:hypothetical protein